MRWAEKRESETRKSKTLMHKTLFLAVKNSLSPYFYNPEKIKGQAFM